MNIQKIIGIFFTRAKIFLSEPRNFILLIFLTGLTLRLGFVFYTGGQINQSDEPTYINQAKYLYQHGLSAYWSMPTDRTPGMGLFILIPFMLFGVNLLKAKLFFALVSSLSIYFIYKYSFDLFGKKTAYYASLIASFYPFFIYWSGNLMTETPAIFFVTAMLFFTNRFIEKKKNGFINATLGGLSLSILIIIRAQNFYFLPFLFGIFIWKKAYKGRLLAALLFFLTAISMPLMWMYKNYINSNLFTLDTHGGITLLMNTAFHKESRIEWNLATRTFEKSKLFEEFKNLNLQQKEYLYRAKAIDYIVKHPIDFIKTRMYNFIQFWRFYPRLNIANQKNSPFLNTKKIYFLIISILTEPFLLILGIFGILISFRERPAIALLPLSFIVFTMLIHTLVIAQMRYRLSIMPIMIIFAVYGISRIMSRGKTLNEKN